jgi:hypothetical protein
MRFDRPLRKSDWWSVLLGAVLGALVGIGGGWAAMLISGLGGAAAFPIGLRFGLYLTQKLRPME